MEKVMPKFKWDIEEWQLVPSDGGRFEISIDGEVIYSKLETGKFPDEDLIVSLIRKQVTGSV
jgi:selenoprotein W-related protein